MMKKMLVILLALVSLAVIGCKSQEEKVQTYSTPTAGDKQKGDEMQQSLKKNQGVPDVARKAMGIK